MLEEDKVYCVILAGGQGRRLDGKGKYLQILNNKSLLEHVISRMKVQTEYLAVNFRNNNHKKINLPTVIDKFKENVGPLAGIHAALSHVNEISKKKAAVVTVPVDTPFVPLDLIFQLKKKFNPSVNDVVIACSRKRHHPTIAMWSSSLKNKIEKSILNNVRKIDFFTKDLRKVFVEWNGNDYDPFYNINDYNDLKLAESMLKKNMIK